MRLNYKYRSSLLSGNFDVFDEYKNLRYRVKARLALGSAVDIYDHNNNHVGAMESDIGALWPRYKLYLGNQKVAEVFKIPGFTNQSLGIDCQGWRIEGKIYGSPIKIMKEEEVVATIEFKPKMFNSSYSINILAYDNLLMLFMIGLAVDSIKSQRGNAKSILSYLDFFT